MKSKFFRTVILTILLTISFPRAVNALYAEELKIHIDTENFKNSNYMYDNNQSSYSNGENKPSFTISSDEEMSSLYIEFDCIPQKWTLEDVDSGNVIGCGENSFLHEFVELKSNFGYMPNNIKLNFNDNTAISEVHAFSSGELPEWVQVWQPPCQQADLILVSTHSDDEQLFFAGVLPYYAIERNLQVQVVYTVQHFEVYNSKDHKRPHEQLDGLWKVGIKNYPIISEFPDLYAESKDRETAIRQAKKVYENYGINYDDFAEYFTECIRRCKPLVIVTHDLNGEYGHGVHALTAEAVINAIECSNDQEKFSDSFEKYGKWQVEKTYLHLYEENPIVMNFDEPLESLNGKTAFQVTQDGFQCHKSQHWTWFYEWIYGKQGNEITKSTQIKSYSPCNYGLYQTIVGDDISGGDFFENVKTYEQQRIEIEQKKKEKEEKEKRIKEELLAKEKVSQQRKERIMVISICAFAICVLSIYFITRKYTNKKH